MDIALSLTSTPEEIDAATEQVGDTADYVVEAGTGQGWTYRKWHSGAVELWKRMTEQRTGTAASYLGISGYSYIIDPSVDGKYPFTVYDPASVANGAVDSNAVTVIYCVPYQTGTSVMLFCSASSGEMQLSMHTNGRWRQ